MLCWVFITVAFLFYLDAFLAKIRPAVQRFVAEETKTALFLGPLVALTAVFAFPLYSSRYLVEDVNGTVWTGGSTYADLPIHMHMANSFLYGRNRVVFFDGMHSPVFAGTRWPTRRGRHRCRSSAITLGSFARGLVVMFRPLSDRPGRARVVLLLRCFVFCVGGRVSIVVVAFAWLASLS